MSTIFIDTLFVVALINRRDHPACEATWPGPLTTQPAMPAGIARRQWTISDLVNLADEWEAMQKAERAAG